MQVSQHFLLVNSFQFICGYKDFYESFDRQCTQKSYFYLIWPKNN